ncbi:MAG: GAF domain-containing protein [Sphaerobacteraceae bacterium]|nr:MAG: GAF domain-containing protein [Sphaerobacteraceae bacterium]
MIEASTFASQALLFCAAIAMAWTTIRSPRRSNVFALTFFALLATVVSANWAQTLLAELSPQLGNIIVAALVLLIPYVLLRLAAEFSSINPLVQRLSEAGLVVSLVLIIYPGTENFAALLFLLAYFLLVAVYAAQRFTIAAATANGISRMRFRALSLGSILLGTALFSVILTTLVEGIVSDVVSVIRQFMVMGAAILYFAGFSPPIILRRAWQEPELRRFLYETRSIPREPDRDHVVAELERISAETIGAPHAAIGLYNEESGRIDFRVNSLAPGETIGGQAFAEGRPILSLDTLSDDPDSRELYEYGQAYAVMAAPITTDDGAIGVLSLYSAHPPIFAEDDLSLLTLLADQIGILLENRRHLELQAELAAREASTRLKDEFLSLAAHDLKTPLTTILATGQYLERRMSSSDEDSTDRRSIARLNREAARLRKLIDGLLDASRIEQGQLVAHFEPTNLSELTTEIVERAIDQGTHTIRAEIAPGVEAVCDALRIQQVMENLLENARKYSSAGSVVDVRLSAEDSTVEFSVTDRGMGISAEDQLMVFDRYFRTERAEFRTAQGIGLGLYICKAIIEQHQGTITVESEIGHGATFRVTIPKDARTTGAYGERETLAGISPVPEH